MRMTDTPHAYGARPQEQPEAEVLTLEDEGTRLVLYNDDFNTFAHVIQCLVSYCGHEPEQAEQCAWIVHLKGRCVVKIGTWEELAPMQAALGDQGLTAALED